MKYFVFLISIFYLIGCNTNDSSSYMGNIQYCKKTILDYSKFRDKGPASEYGKLFSKDATFVAPDLNINLKSRHQLEKRLKKSLKKNSSLHIMTSVNLKAINANEMEGETFFLIYLNGKSNSIKKVLSGRYEDILEVKGKKCFIKNRMVHIDRVAQLPI